MLWVITLILAFVETWVLIEAGKADRRSNRIGSSHRVIWVSVGWELIAEVVLLVTGILIYVENHWLIIPTLFGVAVGTASNKYYRQNKFKKHRFKPKQSQDPDEDEEESL